METQHDLILQKSLPFSVVPTLEVEDQKTGILPEIKRINRIQRVIQISDKQLTALLSAMGTFKRNPSRLEAAEIAQSQVSNWKSGREKMPRWRLAEAVVLFEFLGVLRKQELIDILNSDAEETRKRVAKMSLKTLNIVTVPDLAVLQQQADLQEFLSPFRRALFLRLEADQHLSDADRNRFELWRKCSPLLSATATTRKSESKRSGKRTRRAA